jgi:NDP-hexose-3-ketoreductase
MDTVRFGIIGCSNIARRRFLPALSASSSARLERIGSRTPGKARTFAEAFACPNVGSYEDVLDDGAVDAVYISTPVTVHEPWVRAAVEHGKHVICEKPALMGYEPALEAVRLARKSGIRLLEAYSFRYHPQHALVRSLIGEGRIGEPRFFDGQFTYPQPADGDIRLEPSLGGGVFFDSVGYPIASALMGLPSEPTCVSTAVVADEGGCVDRAVGIMISFSGGEIAQVGAGFGMHYRSRYAVLGTRGRIELERAYAVPPDRAIAVVVETDAGVERITVDPVDAFRLMVDDFADEVRRPAPMRPFEDDLLRQHRVMDAAWRAHVEQRLVFLSEYSS